MHGFMTGARVLVDTLTHEKSPLRQINQVGVKIHSDVSTAQ